MLASVFVRRESLGHHHKYITRSQIHSSCELTYRLMRLERMYSLSKASKVVLVSYNWRALVTPPLRLPRAMKIVTMACIFCLYSMIRACNHCLNFNAQTCANVQYTKCLMVTLTHHFMARCRLLGELYSQQNASLSLGSMLRNVGTII